MHTHLYARVDEGQNGTKENVLNFMHTFLHPFYLMYNEKNIICNYLLEMSTKAIKYFIF